jgi:phosphoribosylaminoimidazole-succinocarboxamide synthase
MPALRSTADLGLSPDYTGKVRDVFDLGAELFIVATDRISAFDVVMDEVVAGRGVVLNVMTLAWLAHFADVPNHVLTADPDAFPAPFGDHAEQLGGRSVLVRKADRFDVECVVRGYLAGSGWQGYQRDGTVCGHTLPAGLRKADRLPGPLFTPATKAKTGHDENIDLATMARIVGEDVAATLRDLSLRLYREGAAHTAARGILLADTKFEFGRIDGEIALIDEVLTPDSSRFWPAAAHHPGEDPPSLDKQILRSWLETREWNREPPPPPVPAEVLARASARYREVLQILFPEEAARWARYL